MTIALGGKKSSLTRLADNPRFQEIAVQVEEFMACYNEPREFVPGKTRIPLNVPTYGAPEVIEALDSLMSTWVTMGAKVKAFEEMFAEYIGQSYGVMTNSGSSANLLALSCLGLKPGDEVITPALTWATTVFPIAQVGAVPVLVDVDRETYNIRPEAIEAAITERTRAIMPVHLLGNPCDMNAILDIIEQHHLWLIEDCCEAHGAEYHGRKVGSFGDVSTFSFFFSHHITGIEGGIICTDNEDFANLCRSMRAFGWIRDMKDRERIAEENPDIDPRFLFATAGFNFRPTEIQGSLLMHQLPKLEGFIGHRRWLADYWNENLKEYEEFLILPYERPRTRHVRFAYSFLIRPGAPFTKGEFQKHLESRGLESRQIEAGDMSIQPAMKHINHRISGSLENSNYIHHNGLFIGCHQGIGQAEADYVLKCCREFFQGFR